MVVDQTDQVTNRARNDANTTITRALVSKEVLHHGQAGHDLAVLPEVLLSRWAIRCATMQRATFAASVHRDETGTMI